MNVMISSCDKGFFKWVIPMYKSFKKFNKSTPMYFGNIDCTINQLEELRGLGVKIVNTPKISVIKENKLSYAFLDMLLYDFLKGVDYDKVMWIDADTLILRNIEGLFSIDKDFVGHPGRDKGGAKMVDDNFPYIGFGLWVTRSTKYLRMLSEKVSTYRNQVAEGKIMRTLLKDSGISVYQLDPSIWNFSRDLVKEAMVDDKGVYYKVRPATIGYSLDDKGNRAEVKNEINKRV